MGMEPLPAAAPVFVGGPQMAIGGGGSMRTPPRTSMYSPAMSPILAPQTPPMHAETGPYAPPPQPLQQPLLQPLQPPLQPSMSRGPTYTLSDFTGFTGHPGSASDFTAGLGASELAQGRADASFSIRRISPPRGPQTWPRLGGSVGSSPTMSSRGLLNGVGASPTAPTMPGGPSGAAPVYVPDLRLV